MDNKLADLAFELSLRALERQERVVDELRTRTGTTLAASSIAASFLGPQAAEEGSGPLSLLATAAFVLSVAAGIHVLRPRGSLVFSLRGSVLFEEEFEGDAPLGETHRRLAYWLERYHDQNQRVVEMLYVSFGVALFGVLLQVVLWVAEIAV